MCGMSFVTLTLRPAPFTATRASGAPVSDLTRRVDSLESSKSKTKIDSACRKPGGNAAEPFCNIADRLAADAITA